MKTFYVVKGITKANGADVDVYLCTTFENRNTWHDSLSNATPFKLEKDAATAARIADCGTPREIFEVKVVNVTQQQAA